MLYLPMFFFGLGSLAIYKDPCWPPYAQLLVTLLILYLLYPLELLDHLISNYNCHTLISHSYGLNTLLTNVMNKYHPFVFYLSVFYFLKYVLALNYPPKSIAIRCNVSLIISSLNRVGWSGVLINLIAL